ncbi:MAG: methyltransferase domain-containing protein [Methylococcaceae bacterium]|nr:MAG: methyltransferase domain-containing protein [Methylococcaceae bacterium]
MTAIDGAVPEKRQVRSAFARAAAHYDRYADLQRRTGEALLARLGCYENRGDLVLPTQEPAGGAFLMPSPQPSPAGRGGLAAAPPAGSWAPFGADTALESLPLGQICREQIWIYPEGGGQDSPPSEGRGEGNVQVRVLVDVGCGTGFFLPKLAEKFPDAVPLALDLTEAMLYQAGNRLPRGCCVCADAEALPLADGCADLLYSNLVLQWCATLERPLREFARVLRGGGVAAFSLFGVDTLQELRLAWREVDAYPRVNDFIAVDALLRQVRAAGLTVVDVQQCRELSTYASVRELMRELKGLGAHNVLGARPRHLTGKSALARMESAYVRQMGGGPIRATYETIGIVVRKP